MDKKGRQTILIFLGLLAVHGIHLDKGNADNALNDVDVLEAMAYTDNLIEPGQIKTEAYKEEPKTKNKKVNMADMQLNEDQAIAAYGETVEDKADQLPAAPAPKVVQSPPQQQEPASLVQKTPATKKEDDESSSDVDISKITPDHKDTAPLKIEESKPKHDSVAQKQPSQEEDDSTVDISSISSQDDINREADLINQEQIKPETKPQEAKEVKQKVKVDTKPKQEDNDDLDEPSDNGQGESQLKEEAKAVVQNQKQVEQTSDVNEEKSLAEQQLEMEKIQKQYKETVKKEKEQADQEKQKKIQDEVDNSMWGQLDAMQKYSKDVVTKAQGYEDPEPVEAPAPAAPAPVLSPEEQEKQATEKMRLFSEFVAADAEANTPVIKPEDPMDKPVHFKYYKNDGESQTDELTDSILGQESHNLNTHRKVMKYDHSDPDWNVTPIQKVDYSKAKINVQEQLIEPLSMDGDEVQEKKQKKVQELTELTIS